MKIIPAIDVLDGQVVRLTQGDYEQKTIYKVSLEDMIAQYTAHGIDHIHIIDLNGAKGDNSNEKFVFDIVKRNKIRIQLGGGIRIVEKAEKLIESGIYRVIIGTVALSDPGFLKELLKKIKPERIIIAIDLLNEVIRYHGWKESAAIGLNDYIEKCMELGYHRFLCTDISKDGKLGGSGIDLYKKMIAKFPKIKLIASGGVGSMQDIENLSKTSAESVVIGKAIYEGKISIEKITDWNNNLV